VRGGTVILAAGDFPQKDGEAWKLLTAAKRVVACDSAADAYRRSFRKWPTVIVGDMDSFSRRHSSFGIRHPSLVVHDPDQDTNDLEKAIALCRQRGWKKPVIVGATGKREDHTLGNVFRGLEHGLVIVTDHGRFLPLCGERTLRVRKGTAVSVFATDPTTRMTSKGLAWPLDDVRFANLYCATLNRASAATVTLTSTRPAYVYVAAGIAVRR